MISVAQEMQARYSIIGSCINTLGSSIDRAIAMIHSSALEQNGTLYVFGNGGSAADAQHLVTELVSKLSHDRPPIAAVALTTNTSLITAISNDVSYDQIFARQVDAHTQKDDILLGITTSGTSPNILEAFNSGHKIGTKNIALTGAAGITDSKLADIQIKVPSYNTQHIQEMHIIISHIICKSLENDLL